MATFAVGDSVRCVSKNLTGEVTHIEDDSAYVMWDAFNFGSRIPCTDLVHETALASTLPPPPRPLGSAG